MGFPSRCIFAGVALVAFAFLEWPSSPTPATPRPSPNVPTSPGVTLPASASPTAGITVRERGSELPTVVHMPDAQSALPPVIVLDKRPGTGSPSDTGGNQPAANQPPAVSLPDLLALLAQLRAQPEATTRPTPPPNTSPPTLGMILGQLSQTLTHGSWLAWLLSIASAIYTVEKVGLWGARGAGGLLSVTSALAAARAGSTGNTMPYQSVAPSPPVTAAAASSTAIPGS
jgi:hypothetical protein